MKRKFLDFLVDPYTKEKLNIKNADSSDYIENGELYSKSGNSYPIIDGVPRFVTKDLYSESLEKKQTPDIQTGNSFGKKWNVAGNIFNDDPEYEKKLWEEQFVSLFGVEKIEDLHKIFQEGMNCLNAGCGVAWSEYLFNINKKVNRYAIDISTSVDIGYARTKNEDNVFIAQADIFNLPFPGEFFDIIFSNGVLHHTNDPKQSFLTLCSHLKPNGLIGIYIYSIKPFIRELSDKYVRERTTEMSFDECLEFSDSITLLGKSLQKFKESLIIEKDIPLLNIKKGEYNLQKFIYDHFLKCFSSDSWGHDYSVMINLDWYHPKFVSHHSLEEIISWFNESGISRLKILQPKGWEYSGYFVSGRKSI